MKEYLEVGKINNTHGVKGELKLILWCDDISYLKQFKTLYLDDKGDKAVKLISARPQKNQAIIKLEGIESMDEAEKLKGKLLYGNRNDAKIDDGANYIADIIGCKVVDIDSGEEYGEIKDVVNYGSCDIYDVEKNKKHTLIPATNDIVKDIDVENMIIKIKKMKGLFDED